MSFKEQLKSDLSIFFNDNEFGEDHIINGKKLNIVIDNDKLEEGKIKNLDGITKEEILYYVKADDFGELPDIDDQQKFDGRFMFVKNAMESNGIYEITLGQIRGE